MLKYNKSMKFNKNSKALYIDVDEKYHFIVGEMLKNKIDVFQGTGSFIDATNIQIDGNKSSKIETRNVIIATGSKPNFFPGMEPDKKRIITSTEALSLNEIPKI